MTSSPATAGVVVAGAVSFVGASVVTWGEGAAVVALREGAVVALGEGAAVLVGEGAAVRAPEGSPGAMVRGVTREGYVVGTSDRLLLLLSLLGLAVACVLFDDAMAGATSFDRIEISTTRMTNAMPAKHTFRRLLRESVPRVRRAARDDGGCQGGARVVGNSPSCSSSSWSGS
jgi:hypothetical protein